MHATLLRRATARTPLIKFLGQRSWPSNAKPGPHPAAPQEIVDKFSEFSSKTASGSPSGGISHSGGADKQSAFTAAYGTGFLPESKKPYDYENFYDAPAYLWQANEFTEREIEAVMSGGATEIRSGP